MRLYAAALDTRCSLRRGAATWSAVARARGVAAVLAIMPGVLERHGSAAAADAVELLRELLLVSRLHGDISHAQASHSSTGRLGNVDGAAAMAAAAVGAAGAGSAAAVGERSGAADVGAGAGATAAVVAESATRALCRRWQRMRRRGWGESGEGWSRTAAYTAAALAGLVAYATPDPAPDLALTPGSDLCSRRGASTGGCETSGCGGQSPLSLADFLFPVEPSAFLNTHFERRPMHREPTLQAVCLAKGLISAILQQQEVDGETLASAAPTAAAAGAADDDEVAASTHPHFVLPSSWCACPPAPADCVDAVAAVAWAGDDMVEVDRRDGGGSGGGAVGGAVGGAMGGAMAEHKFEIGIGGSGLSRQHALVPCRRVPSLGGPLRHDQDVSLVREAAVAKRSGAVVTPCDVTEAMATTARKEQPQPQQPQQQHEQHQQLGGQQNGHPHQQQQPDHEHLRQKSEQHSGGCGDGSGGFSAAVRGLTLRCPAVAQLAEGLSAPPCLAGPAIGANLYCTPAGGAQGLLRHVDDHDVLVGTSQSEMTPLLAQA